MIVREPWKECTQGDTRTQGEGVGPRTTRGEVAHGVRGRRRETHRDVAYTAEWRQRHAQYAPCHVCPRDDSTRSLVKGAYEGVRARAARAYALGRRERGWHTACVVGVAEITVIGRTPSSEANCTFKTRYGACSLTMTARGALERVRTTGRAHARRGLMPPDDGRGSSTRPAWSTSRKQPRLLRAWSGGTHSTCITHYGACSRAMTARGAL